MYRQTWMKEKEPVRLNKPKPKIEKPNYKYKLQISKGELYIIIFVVTMFILLAYYIYITGALESTGIYSSRFQNLLIIDSKIFTFI